MKRISFRVPNDHKERVKECMFAEGAGSYGNYEFCSWEVEGTGQFKPKADANPFSGEKGTVNVVKEFNVMILCEDNKLESVIAALQKAHPYEEPAIEIIDLHLLPKKNER